MLKDTSLRKTLLLSNIGIAYKEIEERVIVFVQRYDTWYYLYRYQNDAHPLYVDRYTLDTAIIELRETGISYRSGWNAGETFENQEIIRYIRR